MSKKLINLSNLQQFLLKLNEKFALKKAMKGISEDAEGNIIIGEEGLVPTPNKNSKGKFLRSDGEWALPSETAVYDSMTIEEGIAGVSEVDKVLNAKNLKQIVNSDGFLTSLDSSKLTGVINIENLPQGALERILIVSSKEERLTLSNTEVQLGDVVKEADTGLMYYVINTEKLNSEEGYTQFTAGMASSVPWSGVTDKPSIPTKTSELTNDSNFAIDRNVVHTSGDETIAGIKTFSDKTISNKELQYTDTKYDWSDTSLNTWCDAGHVAWFDKTGNRRMHELVGANGGVWRKSCFINENQYFSVDSNRNISLNGTVSFNGNTIFTNDMIFKNSNIDLTVTPSSTIYSNYIFKDKNDETLSYIQYVHSPNGIHKLGCFLQDSANNLNGVIFNANKEFYPFGNNSYSLGSSSNKWANVYATTFNGNLKGNADTATKASYLGNYSNGGNKIYLDWDGQVKGYVGLKVDNTVMGGLITTNNIGFQSVSYATTAGSAGNGIDSSGINHVKFKDGTQICWGANKGGIVTFANAFTTTPSIAFGYNIGSDVDRVIHGQASYSSSTSFIMQVWDFKSNTWVQDRTVEWIAIGRWK